MKSIIKIGLSLFLFASVQSCALATNKNEESKTTKNADETGKNQNNMETKVLLETSLGNITLRLFNETPQHRDNFVKLVESGFYNELLFHRVIPNFMIQGGDPDSKNAKPGQSLGAGDMGYTVPAEFVFPKYYHKRGALAAARTGDAVNPQKASSGSQFYIVTGTVLTNAELDAQEEGKKNAMGQTLFQKKVNENMAIIQRLQSENNQQGLMDLQNQFIAEIQQALAVMPPFKFTEEQRKVYTTIGGTPFLDNEYTVFGEVIEGMDVIDKISAAKTGAADRPVEDIKILRATIIK